MTNPPQAEKRPITKRLHGHEWVDNYAWLRAENWQNCMLDPTLLPDDIRTYLDAENAYCAQMMRATEPLQETLIKEMRGRIEADDESLPDLDGPWCYLERYSSDDEHPVYLRRPRTGGQESVTIDFNQEASGYDYFAPGDIDYSPDHARLAWSADTTGSESYTAVIRDLVSGHDTDTIDKVYEFSWATPDVIFYTRLDDQLRANRVYRHIVGSAVEDDVLVYEESDDRFDCSVWTSRSGDYVFLSSDMNDQSEIWFIPTDNVMAEPRLVQARQEGVEYEIEHQGGRFLILTNWQAEDFRIVEAPVDKPACEHWQDVIAHQAGRMVLELFVTKYAILWMERENGLPRICFSVEDGIRQIVEFEEEAYALSLEPLVEFDARSFRFGYESPTTPEHTYEFDLISHTRTLLKQQVVPSGHDPSDYIARRLQARAKDGEQIPLTVLYHRTTPLDGSAPCVLDAYGAYGDSIPASFSTTVLSLVDRGVISVVAHIRGGQEKGRAWYEAAKGLQKQNSFDDFIAAGKALVEQGFTQKGRIVISGASAGGLTMGAVINQESDLWGGVIAEVPFVDILNTMIDASLPLTPGEWSQWGNPIEDASIFHEIKRYAPYDNVQARPYPPMLVTAGVSDPRVTYWEPAKWVARHRELRSDDNLLVLKTNMSSGHYGETGRYASLKDYALCNAFTLQVLGMNINGADQ